MAGSGDRHGVRDGSVRDLQANVPRTTGTENTLREARRSEPALCGGGQHGRTGVAAAVRPCRNTVHPGGSENVNPQARPVQRGRTGTQSARHGLRSVGASMVVGKVNSVGALAGPSPRNAVGAPSVQQPREPLSNIPNGQANRKPVKAATVGAPQQGPLPTLLTSSACATVSPSLCCSVAAAAAVAAAKAEGDEAVSTIFDGDTQDTQKVGEYASDIFARLLEKESLWLPKPDYMDSQPDINGKMRAILIDWLVEVHMKYHLRPETLFLTVNIIDRYLSLKHVARKKLQLLGVVAMLIAAKFEEIDPPRVHEFSYITDNTYLKKEILNMEATVLVTLDFQIAVPTPAHFLDRLQRANGCDGVIKSLAMYALELSLLDLRSLRYPPSLLVGASLLLSNAILGRRPVWPVALAHCTKRTESSLWACAEELRGLMEAAKGTSLQAVRRKYQVDQKFAVAHLNLPGPGTLGPPRGAGAIA